MPILMLFCQIFILFSQLNIAGQLTHRIHKYMQKQSQFQQKIDQTMQNMLQKVQPKTRYLCEVHVDEYNDSIYKEIINGDIEISRERLDVNKNNKEEKHGFEEMLRKRLLQQVEKEKSVLEHKLGYLSNSINSIKKHDQLKTAIASPRSMNRSMRASFSVGTSRGLNEQWRAEIKKRQKQLQQKKAKIEEERKKRDEQMKEMMQRLKQQKNEKKKKQIADKIKALQQRTKARDQQIKEGNQRYFKLRNEKNLHERISQQFQQRQLSFLEEQKKKLAQIRNLKRPINEQQLKDHELKFMQLKKQKQQLRERERKMNQSRSKSYKPMYQSMFYKKILESAKNQQQNPSVIKSQKMKQFADHVKEHFVPQIDQKKKHQLQEAIQRQKRKQQERLQKQRQLLQKSKIKGLQYLEIIRNIPKKKKSKQQHPPPQSDRIKYENYLTHRSSPVGGQKSGGVNTSHPSRQPWSKILNSSIDDKEVKALKIQYQSQRKQQQLKRRQKEARLLKNQDSSLIDEEYFKMIKAKLDLLQA